MEADITIDAVSQIPLWAGSIPVYLRILCKETGDASETIKAVYTTGFRPVCDGRTYFVSKQNGL